MILSCFCPAISKKIFFLLILTIIYLSLFTKDVFAAGAPIFYDVPPSSNSQIRPASACERPEECANTAVPGQANQCGAACPDSGSGSGAAWTKYGLTCVLDPDTERLTGHYLKENIVYSIADKCGDGGNYPQSEPYLRTGECDGSIGGIYKVCCANGGGISPNSCVPVEPFSGAPFPPIDGVCPGGSYKVECGPGTGVACNASACGSTGEPPPPEQPPPEQPPPGPSGPSLTTFEGYNPTGEVACYKTGYKANLSWSGNPLPSSDSSCPNGYWVDIDDNSSFSSYSNKCVPGTSTSAPDGFGGPGGAFTFNQGTTYYARVYNGSKDKLVYQIILVENDRQAHV